MSITQVPSITRIVKPSLACFVANPFGLTLGDVGDRAAHSAIVTDVLREATRPHPAGTIVQTKHRLPGDLRANQLHKDAH